MENGKMKNQFFGENTTDGNKFHKFIVWKIQK